MAFSKTAKLIMGLLDSIVSSGFEWWTLFQGQCGKDTLRVGGTKWVVSLSMAYFLNRK
jgi:hypothetical protein